MTIDPNVVRLAGGILVLVFHHRDPATKKFQVGQNQWGRRRSVILEEIAKCDVLCANCHQIQHYKRLTPVSCQSENSILKLGG